MPRFIDLTDKKFGRLQPISKEPPKNGRSMWKCLCDCGAIAVIRTEHLTTGRSTSCGCYSKESHSKHGRARTPEYKSWQHLRERCGDSQNPSYKHYGGRGITVCARWQESFENFFSDMGERPSVRHSIDRIDNDGDYSPKNCRWASPLTQINNRRNTLKATVGGVTKSVKAWCDDLQLVSYRVAYVRIKRGVPPDIAVTAQGHSLRGKQF